MAQTKISNSAELLVRVQTGACRHGSCDESTLSFSEFCWNHVDRPFYLKELQEALQRADPGAPLVLHLKRVDAEGLDFSNLNLAGSSLDQTKLSRCVFIGCNLAEANLIGASFTRCDFVGADLSKANLTRALFSHTSLCFADLRNACFIEAVFRDTDFTGAVLWKANLWNADLSGAAHIKKKSFSRPSKPADDRWVRLLEADALVALESYRSVKHYFYQKGLVEDAGWAAYRELTMERKHYYRSRDPRYLPSLFMDILSGYTEKPFRVIVSSLGIILLFGLVYYALGAVRPTLDTHLPMGFWDNIYFSFMTFTTVGFGDFVPNPQPWVRILVCIEAFSGPFMAGLYIFTLTRRYAAN